MFSVDNTVLLVIDVQGKLAQMMHEKDHLFSSLETIIKGMTILDVPIILMEQIPKKLGPTINEVAELLPDINPIAKHTFSCCNNEEFMSKFNALERNQVLLTGIETHICVYQTGMDLLKKNYEVQVVADCVSSRTLENKTIGIDCLVRAGASVTSVEMILFELMKAAQGEKFREMVKIVK
ncbi:MAG: hydrolase [Desulfobacteraceae bacterium]